MASSASSPEGVTGAAARLGANLGWVLILSTIALLVTKALFNVPLGIMAVIALVRLCQGSGLARTTSSRHLGVMFLAVWLPMALSLPDAVNLARSAKTVALYPHFLLAALYVADEIRKPGVLGKVVAGTLLIGGVWIVDALIQAVWGRNILGYPYSGGRLTGLFHPKFRLGHVLAVLSPVYFEWLRRTDRRWPWLFLPALCGVVLLGGRRSAWLLLLASTSGYLLFVYLRFGAAKLGRALLPVGALALALVVTAFFYEGLSARIEHTAKIFSTNVEDLDTATSHRLSLWVTARNIAAQHWLNGIGPRGFRYVYADYAGEDDWYLRKGRPGGTHPHSQLMEIVTETGIIGLAGYLVLIGCIVRLFLRAPARIRAGPWLIGALAAWMPFNTHLAFYGTYWSTIGWLLLAIGVGAAFSVQGEAGEGADDGT